jgi:hypothetical protein
MPQIIRTYLYIADGAPYPAKATQEARVCALLSAGQAPVWLNLTSPYKVAHLFLPIHIMACLLEGRTVKPAETAFARERLCKHVRF